MHPNFPLLGQPISAMLMGLVVKPAISHLKSMRNCSAKNGIQDGTIFKVPKSFDLFIKGAREININFTKITNLALYRILKKSDLESQS
jgi:hypothetical protein